MHEMTIPPPTKETPHLVMREPATVALFKIVGQLVASLIESKALKPSSLAEGLEFQLRADGLTGPEEAAILQAFLWTVREMEKVSPRE